MDTAAELSMTTIYSVLHLTMFARPKMLSPSFPPIVVVAPAAAAVVEVVVVAAAVVALVAVLWRR